MSGIPYSYWKQEARPARHAKPAQTRLVHECAKRQTTTKFTSFEWECRWVERSGQAIHMEIILTEAEDVPPMQGSFDRWA